MTIQSIRKERPAHPIEIRVPRGAPGVAPYRYRRYENGNWNRSDDSGRTWGNVSEQELALLAQLLKVYIRRNGEQW